MLLSPRTGIIAAIVISAVTAGSAAFAYNHGKSIERGKSAKKLERLGDNYVALLINEKTEKFAEIGYERQRAREALQTAEKALDSGDRSRAANRAALIRERERAADAERQAAEILNNLERMPHEWASQRVPNDFVCGVYHGVLDIPGCTDAGTAAPADNPNYRRELFGPEPPDNGIDSRARDGND